MKRFTYLLALLLFSFPAFTQDPKEWHETAKAFMRQGDYANAVLVLNRVLQVQPGDMAMNKDLALCFYFQKENSKALETIKPLLGREGTDDQCFQIAGNIYRALDRQKDCEKMYKKGIKKFPASGPLYNELGELLFEQQKYNAIQYWEAGIRNDPSYSKNYLNAARYYYLTTDKVWSLLYGEIFVNMEPTGQQTPEIKEILLNSYKKLFAEARIEIPINEKNSFIKNFLQALNKQSSIASQGIDIESLIMIRARFILEWGYGFKDKFPFKLFEYHQQLLQTGMFEAYNQWLFGSTQNLVAFQNWTQVHSQEYNNFINFQKSRMFKVPPGQYYH
jgi:tetratricopeptide (TPR) repeat protein